MCAEKRLRHRPHYGRKTEKEDETYPKYFRFLDGKDFARSTKEKDRERSEKYHNFWVRERFLLTNDEYIMSSGRTGGTCV